MVTDLIYDDAFFSESELFTTRKYTNKEDWLQARTHGIGGSEICAIMGLHPFKTADDVLAAKQGVQLDQATSKAMEMGNTLEGLVLGRYADSLRRMVPAKQRGEIKVWRNRRVFTSRETPIAQVTPDAFIRVSKEQSISIAEIKTTARWTDAKLLAATMQVQWGLFITGLDLGSICVWDTRHHRVHSIYSVERNEDMINNMVLTATEFWRSYGLPTP